MEAIAYLLYFIFVCVGIYLFRRSYPLLRKNLDARKWDISAGEITQVKLGQEWVPLDSVDLEDHKQFTLGYEYEYEGNKHFGESLGFDKLRIHNFKNNKETGFYTKDLNQFLKMVQFQPSIKVSVNPHNPKETIILNNWILKLMNLCFAMTFIIWGVCMTRMFMSAESNIGSVKLEDKIEVIEMLSPEVIKELKAVEATKEKEEIRKGIEANLKWRKEQGLPID